MTKKIFITAVTLGATAIIFGAFGAHALKEVLSESSLISFKTAVNYQMYHALFLLVFGLLHLKFGGRGARGVFYTCTIGMLFFAGSIYILTLNSHYHFIEIPKTLGLVTPIGGVLLILSWVLLGVYFVKNIKEKQDA